MRKSSIYVVTSIFLAIALAFNSCKRETTDSLVNNDEFNKVSAWLEAQKPAGKPNKSANVELLKNNLDFSRATYEELNKNSRLLVIPVKEKFSTEKNIDRKTIVELLLAVDNSGAIQNGHLILFEPAGESTRNIPSGTFAKMYNNQKPQVDGLFKFLSVTGRWIYQREYKNGELKKIGVVQSKIANADSRTTTCFARFLILYYIEGGVQVNTDYIYLGIVCEGCDDPLVQSVCSDGPNGGGDGGESNCCIPDPNASWTTESISEGLSESQGIVETDPATGNETTTRVYPWYYNRNYILWYSWSCKSIETATLEKEGGLWKFTSIAHTGSAVVGEIPPCVEFNTTITSTSSSIENNGEIATFTINYTNSFRLTCVQGAGTVYQNGVAAHQWNAN